MDNGSLRIRSVAKNSGVRYCRCQTFVSFDSSSAVLIEVSVRNTSLVGERI
jgi:hypothetical protein